MANHGPLAKLDIEKSIEEIANGTMLKQIAARYGVSKVAVRKHLAKHPGYAEAVKEQAHSFVEDAMTELSNCDVETVNIARAKVDGAFKYARAMNPEVFGDKLQVNHHIDLTAIISDGQARLIHAQQAAIDGDAERIEDDSAE